MSEVRKYQPLGSLKMNVLIKKLRKFTSVILEQVFYYLVLLVALFTWSYFESGYVALAVFIVGSVLAWFISSRISVKEHANK